MNKQLSIAAGLMLALVSVAAERPCAPLPSYILVSWLVDPATTCVAANYWVQPVDLDGDGVAEFSHERNRAEHHAISLQGQGRAYYYQDDEIEAYYPEAHVQMYVRTWGPGNISMLDPKLAVGQIIEPDPPALAKPYWCWGGACSTFALEALGVGIVMRTTDKSPCGWPNFDCGGTGLAGFLYPDDLVLLRQQGVFGFRLQGADGWHLGWLKLSWQYEPPLGPVVLLASAVHPEPDKPITAGEPARPELAVWREGEEIILGWATVWTGYRLERSPALRPPAWEAVPGVSSNAIRLPSNEAPAFFRLRR
ncbi:MAG: hypothetical protein M5U12_12225 [Verrucomicrobia bacterium]|nr:hypothetical protein [Verrucomicrobiota bacterium]